MKLLKKLYCWLTKAHNNVIVGAYENAFISGGLHLYSHYYGYQKCEWIKCLDCGKEWKDDTVKQTI